MFKMVGAIVLVAGALYFGGVFGSSYSRVVARSPAEVANAIVDLDITSAPGAPGSDPSATGGVRPVIGVERYPDRVVWTVRSGDKVATRMIALLEPIEGGKQTRVRTKVERGDAPDDYVSPAFRSERQTLTLFSIALEAELNDPTLGGWGPECEAIIDRIRNQAADNPDRAMAEAAQSGPGFGAAMGRVAKMGVKINAIDTELRTAGCNPDANRGEFRQVESYMGPADPAQAAESEHPEVSFQPGTPMIDTSRPGR